MGFLAQFGFAVAIDALNAYFQALHAQAVMQLVAQIRANLAKMMSYHVTLEGGLKNEAVAIGTWADFAAAHAATRIAEDARQRVPVDEGDLYEAIHVERVGAAEYAVVAGDETAFYGHMVEFGTTKTPARPFLTPALEAVRDEIADELAASLRSALAKGGVTDEASSGFAAALATSIDLGAPDA